MNAYRSGSDLVELMLRVSQGETPAALPEKPRRGVFTHLAMQALLGLRIARRDAERHRPGRLAIDDGQRTLRGELRRTHGRCGWTGSARCRC